MQSIHNRYFVQTIVCIYYPARDQNVDMQEINRQVIEEFRSNDGQLSGPMQGAPVLLLTTTGRRSGASHTTPVGYIDIGGRLAVAASNGGSDQVPDWFLNLGASDRVRVELPGATIDSIAKTTTSAERLKLLDQMVTQLPGMADHLAATDREVPVVILEAIRP